MKIFVICFVSVLLAARLKADDVYNFYFQKAPGPSTVYQGGGSSQNAPSTAVTPTAVIQTPQVPPQANTVAVPVSNDIGQNTVKVEPPPKHEEEKGFSRWELLFGKSSYSPGVAELGDSSSGGYLNSYSVGDWDLGVQFNIWRSLGIELRAMQIVGQSIGFAGDSMTLDYSAGLVFTPFHINVYGYDLLDLGFTGGYTTVPLVLTVPYGGSSTISGHLGTYFGGVKAEVNIGRSFAIMGAAEEIPEASSSRLTFGAVFKL